MPFVTFKTNLEIDVEQENQIKAALGKAIGFLPGKHESNLLLEIEDERRLWLGGSSSEPLVLIEVRVFASEDRLGYDRFVEATTDSIASILNLDARRIYFRFEDIPAWGLGGKWVARG